MKYTVQQGEGSSVIFSAEKSKTRATLQIYGQSAKCFAGIVKKKLKPNRQYVIVDLGSFDGKFLKNFFKLLPKYKFYSIGIDRWKNIRENNVVKKKIISDIANIPLPNNSADVVLARYVLIWNNAEKQKNILKEISRITRRFAIIQTAGASVSNPDLWKKNMARLLSGKEVYKLKRVGYYFSSMDEIEKWMKELKIDFQRVQNRKVSKFSDVFCEKYNLNKKERDIVRDILGDQDFTIQNTWIIYPKNKCR